MKLTIYQIFFINILIFSASVTQAQNIDEIIALHIKAHGGMDKWEAIKSMKITGRYTAFSEEENISIIKTNEGAYYADLHLGQYEIVESFDGKTGWTIDPWHDFIYPRELNKAEVNVFYQKSDFFTPFYKYKEKGCKVELVGEQNIDGVDTYVIKLTRLNGKTETWYLDAKTYLEYKYESDWVDFAYESPAESYFDDFREVDGLVLPFFIERTFFQRDRILQIENIEFNIDVDKNIFEMPKSSEINKLAFLVGEWNVKFEIWSRRGSWIHLDNTTSTIDFIATNMIEEEIKYERIYVQAKVIDYTYNSKTEKYRVAIFNEFSSNIELFEGNFTDSTFSVENTFVSFSDTTQSNIFTKITFSEVEKDGFIVEISRSRDEGATWTSTDKLTYTRREESTLLSE